MVKQERLYESGGRSGGRNRNRGRDAGAPR